MTDALLSHPDKDGGSNISKGAVLLQEHLEAVARLASDHAPEPVAGLATYAALFHDFGKATSYFQDYLVGKRSQGTETNHSDISALASYYALEDVVTDTERLAIYFAIHYHHQPLSNANASAIHTKLAVNNSNLAPHEQLCEKTTSLENNASTVQAMYDSLLPSQIDFDVSSFCDWVRTKQYVELPLNQLSRKCQDKHGSNALLTPIIYNALCSADVKDAAGYPTLPRGTVSEGNTTHYINGLETNNTPATHTYTPLEFPHHSASPPDFTGSESVADLRAIARREIQYEITNAPLSTRFFDVQLPTGLGKTLSGIEAAMRRRSRIMSSTSDTDNSELLNTPPRIVYAMPQTSIIDQNHDVIKHALTNTQQTSTSSPSLTPDQLLKHHYLSDETYSTSDIDYGEYKYESHLTTQWHSEFITTTFVQLLESLCIPSKKQTHRFQSLENAILVLDEVQALPTKHWELIQHTLEYYAELFNWTIITMTATDPKITPESHALVPRSKQYYDALDRVAYSVTDSVKGSPCPVDETAEFALSQLTTKEVNTVLCISNTISQAKTLHETLKTRLAHSDEESADTPRLVYLSSNLPHKVREERIKKLTRNNAATQPTIVVSTQVVEAGVDMSADCVIREIAPLDSIVQASGRCNRNGMTGEQGIVYVIQTESEWSPATFLYGQIPIEVTRTLLLSVGGDGSPISSNTLTNTLLDRYYNKLKQTRETAVGVSELEQWEFSDAALSLIPSVETVDVFIEDSKADTQIRKAYAQAIETHDWADVTALKPEFYSRVVSLTVYHADSDGQSAKEELPPFLNDNSHGVYVVDTTDERYTKWFDEATGVCVPEDTVDMRVI